ncbi:MAG: hypothetical protein IJH78_01165 [Clostridia bacterium]|nr:hypothetical protein [Clostridia bacterium]
MIRNRACTITTGGDNDLMTDELRESWAAAIVEAQTAETDVITGASLTFSAGSVQEAVADILAQASGAAGEPAGEAAGGLTDGTYTSEKENSFSTVKVDATVEGGAITACTITTGGDNDLMTDELRESWAAAIVEAQTAETDVITGASLTFSAASVQEAVADILAQASGN